MSSQTTLQNQTNNIIVYEDKYADLNNFKIDILNALKLPDIITGMPHTPVPEMKLGKPIKRKFKHKDKSEIKNEDAH